jgi:WD40-like Beta Propeller Repeat
MTSRAAVAVAGVVAVAAPLAAVAWAGGPHFSVWAPAQKIDEIAGNSVELNTVALDGCPIESPDRLSLYMASDRPGGLGGIDIWCPPCEQGCSVGGACERGRAGELGGQ